MESLERDNPNFWKLHNIDSTYWDEYIATRPVYDEQIFNRINDYQSLHSESRQTALDIGTGSGSALGPLVQRFDHVVASDNDSLSLDYTRRRFSALPAERLSYTLSSGEELLQHHAPNSFDLITCAETFPLMDMQTALHNIWTLLRPGATVALWFYGPPFFVNPKHGPICQQMLDRIMDDFFRPVVSGGGDARKQSWKRAADGKFSWLDNVPFPAEQWRDVRRHKWNTGARLSFFTSKACDFPVEPVSRVGEQDVVTEEQNTAFWQVAWGPEKLERFVRASFPKPRELLLPGQCPEMALAFKQFSNLMGGPNAVEEFSWPAVLVLASKRVSS